MSVAVTARVTEPIVVYEFARANDREVVRASLHEYHGRRVADLRIWLPRSSDGVLVPSPKGIAIDRALLPDLAAAVRALAAAEHAADPSHHTSPGTIAARG